MFSQKEGLPQPSNTVRFSGEFPTTPSLPETESLSAGAETLIAEKEGPRPAPDGNLCVANSIYHRACRYGPPDHLLVNE